MVKNMMLKTSEAEYRDPCCYKAPANVLSKATAQKWVEPGPERYTCWSIDPLLARYDMLSYVNIRCRYRSLVWGRFCVLWLCFDIFTLKDDRRYLHLAQIWIPQKKKKKYGPYSVKRKT